MKSIFSTNLSQLKFILAFENWQSFFILILIDVLEYE